MAIAARLANHRPYYGWDIVGLAYLSFFMSTGLGQFGPAVFLKPMTEELEWSRGFYSLASSMGALLMGPLSLLVGPVMDRRGGRGLMVVCGVITALGVMALGLVHTQWQFLLVRGVLITIGMAGTGQLVGAVAVSNWFVRRRGRAMALAAMGFSTGGIVTPPLATFLIETLGWRQAWVVLGMLPLVLIAAPAALLMRRRPEDIGLLPDGGPPTSVSSPSPARASAASAPEVTWTRQEALRSPTVWVLVFAFPLGQMGVSAVYAHLYAYVTDMGLTIRNAAVMQMVISSVSLGSKPLWGLASERVPVRYCLAAGFSLLGVALGLLATLGPNLAALLLTAVIIGLGWGGLTLLQALTWGNYFGRLSQGRVQSLGMPVAAVSGALGPVLAGYLYDVTGTYRGIFLAYIVTQALAAMLILMVRPPTKKLSPPAVAPAGPQ